MTADFLNRGKEYISMLESSKYMCERNGLDALRLSFRMSRKRIRSAAKSMSQDISDSCEKAHQSTIRQWLRHFQQTRRFCCICTIISIFSDVTVINS